MGNGSTLGVVAMTIAAIIRCYQGFHDLGNILVACGYFIFKNVDVNKLKTIRKNFHLEQTSQLMDRMEANCLKPFSTGIG